LVRLVMTPGFFVLLTILLLAPGFDESPLKGIQLFFAGSALASAAEAKSHKMPMRQTALFLTGRTPEDLQSSRAAARARMGCQGLQKHARLSRRVLTRKSVQDAVTAPQKPGSLRFQRTVFLAARLLPS